MWRRTSVGVPIRKSPFEGLIEHAAKVRECVHVLDEALSAFEKGDMERFETLKQKVEDLESEADRIKANVRNHLPKSVWMPVDKQFFLMTLTQQDSILDYAEDAVVWIDMRGKPLPPELAEGFSKLQKIVVKTVDEYEKVINNIPHVLETSFSDKERKETKEYIYRVHSMEHESDLVERELTKKIFSMEDKLDPITIWHLIKLVSILGDIADHAENAADRVRAMIAK
jgi:predicted phosphate transport protein (TIGR00153 family)